MRLHRKTLTKYTLHYKACTKSVPVLLCTTKLAQSTSQHYFALQNLHKTLPSTTLYYKACTKCFPILLCTTKLELRCTKYVPVLLCTTKLSQSTSQYLYYKAFAKYFPSANTSLSQPWCSHSITIYHVQLRKTIVWRTQPRRQATFWTTCEKAFKRKNHQRQNWENLLTNPYRSLDVAIPLRFTMSSCKRHYARSRDSKQPWRSHCTAICNQRVNKRIDSRTHEQPLVAEHRGGTDYTLKRSKPHPPHTRGTFHRRLQPLSTQKTRFRAPAFLPTQGPVNLHLHSHSTLHWV